MAEQKVRTRLDGEAVDDFLDALGRAPLPPLPVEEAAYALALASLLVLAPAFPSTATADELPRDVVARNGGVASVAARLGDTISETGLEFFLRVARVVAENALEWVPASHPRTLHEDIALLERAPPRAAANAYLELRARGVSPFGAMSVLVSTGLVGARADGIERAQILRVLVEALGTVFDELPAADDRAAPPEAGGRPPTDRGGGAPGDPEGAPTVH